MAAAPGTGFAQLHQATGLMAARAGAFLDALGSTQRVVVLGTDGLYAGMASVQDLHDPEREVADLNEVLHLRDAVLTPEMNVKEALAVFEQAEADALAVVAGAGDRRVIGLLTEQHALRRYSEELDRTSRDLAPT